jgi:hypothetical protein
MSHAAEQTLELAPDADGVGSGGLVGRSVSVRNNIDHHGLKGMCVLDDQFRILGAGKHVEARIVSVHPCWRGAGFGFVRLEYPGSYFRDKHPRYGNTAMRHLRSPNKAVMPCPPK